MTCLFSTGVLLLIIIVIFLALAIYLQDFSDKNGNSVWAGTFSRWSSSVAAGATFILIVGIALFYFPKFRNWDVLTNPK